MGCAMVRGHFSLTVVFGFSLAGQAISDHVVQIAFSQLNGKSPNFYLV